MYVCMYVSLYFAVISRNKEYEESRLSTYKSQLTCYVDVGYVLAT